MKRYYLRHIRIDSFGSFFNRTIGPFSPHLNVIYGKNETGKTTIASFIGGVLFGWEKAHGLRNTYRPAHAERAGALFFAPSPDTWEKEPNEHSGNKVREHDLQSTEQQSNTVLEQEIEMRRNRNVDGLQGDLSVIEDLDKETYETIFSLNSDELRSLRNTSNVTARLLTAGSGTGASPASALEELERQIATYTSKAVNNKHSLVRLAEQRDKLRAKIRKASEETDRMRFEDREYHELKRQRVQLSVQIADLNKEIEELAIRRDRLKQLFVETNEVRHQMNEVSKAMSTSLQDLEFATDKVESLPVSLSSAEEHALRDELDELAEEQTKTAHSVDMAKEDSATSQAAFEALTEVDVDARGEYAYRKKRRLQIGLSALLSLAFIGVGVAVFIRARQIGSLSITALGVGLIGFSLIMAAGALVMVFRSDKTTNALDARQQDARWVMLQDKKKLEVRLAAKDQIDDEIRLRLENEGLEEAHGSIRAARVILDAMRDAHAQLNLAQQRQASLDLRESTLKSRLRDLEDEIAAITRTAGGKYFVQAVDFDELIQKKEAQRATLLETSEETNRRYGQLGQLLEEMRPSRSFDELKLDYQQVRTRMKESKCDLVRLLLARRILERAIATWESRSQPEVYRTASRYLSLMTQGKWVRVSMTGEGHLIVVNALHETSEPQHLSLGTCQQLYLALRIALLQHAENVGSNIPILADDILVNFDAERRKGAAQALAELARTRQVLLFTCHKEVVESMRAADPGLTEVAL